MYRAIVFRESIGLVIEGPPPFRYVILTYPLRRGCPTRSKPAGRTKPWGRNRFSNSGSLAMLAVMRRASSRVRLIARQAVRRGDYVGNRGECSAEVRDLRLKRRS